jgi:hypothetical protein
MIKVNENQSRKSPSEKAPVAKSGQGIKRISPLLASPAGEAIISFLNNNDTII